MYKTLPNEDVEQRKARMQKEARELGLKFPDKPLIETNPYITPEAVIRSVETSTAIEGVHVKIDISEKFDIPEKFEKGYPKIKIKEIFKKRGRPKKGK